VDGAIEKKARIYFTSLGVHYLTVVNHFYSAQIFQSNLMASAGVHHCRMEINYSLRD